VWDIFSLEVGKLFWWLVDLVVVVVVVVVVDGGLRFRIDRRDQRVLIGTASDGSASASKGYRITSNSQLTIEVWSRSFSRPRGLARCCISPTAVYSARSCSPSARICKSIMTNSWVCVIPTDEVLLVS
jgi:hypothetical protein